MKTEMSRVLCACKKPLITIGDAENGKFATVTALGVFLLAGIILLHVCAYKLHGMMARKKANGCSCE